VWCVPVADRRGPYAVENARPITDERLYSGRLVSTRDGRWCLLAFRNVDGTDDGTGTFIGELTDPMTVAWNADRTSLIVDT
jgi:beta-fructofuranosidase